MKKANPGNIKSLELVRRRSREFLDMEVLGKNQYRLYSSPILGGLHFGDVIECEKPARDGSVTLRRRVSRSPFKTYSAIVSKETATSAALAELLGRVNAGSGYSEQIFGGVVLIHLPPDSALDIRFEFDRVQQIKPDETHGPK